MKKVILSEEQIRRMVDKLVVNEQTKVVTGTKTNTEQKTFPSQNLGDLFDYGQIDSQKVKDSITSLKPKIEEFIKNSDSRNFILKIDAGESLVTNPKGYEKRGSLAFARASTVKKYFDQLFPELIQNGTLKIDSPVDITSVKIGTTPYKPGDQNNPNLIDKYKSEQFVTFSINGIGSKTTKTETYKYLCETKPLKSSGGVLPFDSDYTQMIDWNLNRGEGRIKIWLDTISMPDIIYFEYNGKTYGSNLFRGTDMDSYRFLIGTALRARFGTNLPEHMKGNTIIPIEPTNADLILALMDTSNDSIKAWGMMESFSNIFGQGSTMENDRYTDAFFDYDQNHRVKRLLNNLGPSFPWGYLTSKILPGKDLNTAMIDKIDGIDTVKIINVAPNGATGWQIGLTCQSTK